MPASRMGLRDRGMLKVGYKADLLIWDANTIEDNATYADPHRYATGIDYVIVNGVLVIDKGANTNARPGVALRANQ